MDRGRGDPAFQAPPEHDPRAMITAAYAAEPRLSTVVTTLLRPGTAYSLRRRASEVRPGRHEVGEWDTVILSELSQTVLVSELAGLGPDVKVLDPPDVADAVRARLQAVLDQHDRSGSW